MSPVTKARLSYLVLGIIYFLGGMEYALFIPRIWAYISNLSETLLGSFVSAYSVGTCCSAPLFGRWVDKSGVVKKAIMAGVLLHIIGGVMHLVNVSSWWFLITAKFVSGFGGGMDAVVVAEIIRYSSLEDRTYVLSILLGIRQLAVLIIPGLVFCLWKPDYRIITVSFKKSPSPDIVVILLWTILALIIMCIYTELSCLRLSPHPSSHSISSSHSQIVYCTGQGNTRPHLHDKVNFEGSKQDKRQNNARLHSRGKVNFEGSKQDTSQPVLVPSPSTAVHSSQTQGELLVESSEMIEEAEKYIQLMAEKSFNSQALNGMALSQPAREGACAVLSRRESFHEGDECQMSTSFNHSHRTGRSSDTERDCVDGPDTDLSADVSCESFDHNSYMERSCMPFEEEQSQSLLHLLCHVYMNDGVITLLFCQFTAVFVHLCFQMTIMSIKENYLHGNDIYGIIVYSLAVGELLSVLMFIWWLAARIGNVGVVVTGISFLLLASIVIVSLVPTMKMSPVDYVKNLVQVAVVVFLFIPGVPLLTICATSVFSTITGMKSQGLSQGLQQSTWALASLMATLWSTGNVKHPSLLFGVLVGLLILALVLLLISYKRLVTSQHEASGHQAVHVRASAGEAASNERQPLLQ